MNHFIAAAFTLLLSASSVLAQPFSHGITDGPTPWTDKDFDVGEDRFMFAIHSDLTGGERPQVFEIAMAQLNLLRPEFVISVGDLSALVLAVFRLADRTGRIAVTPAPFAAQVQCQSLGIHHAAPPFRVTLVRITLRPWRPG